VRMGLAHVDRRQRQAEQRVSDPEIERFGPRSGPGCDPPFSRAVNATAPYPDASSGAEVKGAPSLYEFTEGGALTFTY